MHDVDEAFRRHAGLHLLALVSFAFAVACRGGSSSEKTTAPPLGSARPPLAVLRADTDTSSALYIVNEDASELRRLTGPAVETRPSWSSDRKRLLFLKGGRTGNSDVYIIGADGSNLTQITDVQGRIDHASWSRDGLRVAYSQTLSSPLRMGIYVTSLQAGSPVRITPAGQYADQPQWSPDGAYIVYRAGPQSGMWDLWRVRADGTEPIQLTTDGGYQPSWSPDGTRIVFERNRRIWTMKADGSDQRQVTSSEPQNAVDVMPDWSPDGSLIVFNSTFRPNVAGLVAIRPDGTGLRMLLSGDYFLPAWR